VAIQFSQCDLLKRLPFPLLKVENTVMNENVKKLSDLSCSAKWKRTAVNNYVKKEH
jgi:hypothetical protein